MAIIRVHKNIFFQNPVIHHEGHAVNLLDWLSESDYQDLRHNGAVIRLNGIPMVDTTKQEPDEATRRVDVMLGAFDEIDIIYVPEGLTATGWLIVANLALTAVSFLLMPKQDQQEIDQERTSNNQFNASRNRYRVREAIADLAGVSRIYPDFLQPSYWEYEDNQRVFTEWFSVGVGRNQVTSVKSAETLVENIPGSSVQTYAANFPATIRKGRTVDELTDIPLPTERDPSRFAQVGGGTLDGVTGLVDVNDTAIPGALGLSPGVNIRITGTYFDINVQQTIGIDIEREVVSVSGSEITVGSFPAQSQAGTWDGDIRNLSIVTVSPWIVLPDESDQLVFNLEMPRGIRAQEGGELTIDVQLSYQEVDADGEPIGSIVTEFEQFIGNTPNPQRKSFKFNVPASRYRVRASNFSARSPAAALQDLVLSSVFGTIEYSTAGFDDITIMRVMRRSNAGASGGASGDKINCRAQRLLRIFNPGTGLFSSGYQAATSFAQYVMYLLVERGGIPLSKIDYTGLFAIEQSLSLPDLGRFNFSFDDKFQSLDSRIAECCDVARVAAYRIGGDYYRFVRDEQRTVSMALFNRRNLISGQASERFETYRDFDFDSVELEWINPVDNTPSYVRRRINLTTGAIENGVGSRPQEFLLKGCQNEAQAINRAEFEVRVIKYRRQTVSDTATSEALNVSKGAQVEYASIMRDEIFHGEVLGREGDTFFASEKFLPDAGVTYYVMLLDAGGNVSNSVVATAVAGDEFAFTATGLTSYSADGYEIQLGSLYIIAPDNKQNASKYILTKRGSPNAAGECAIELVNDDERVYEMD